MTQPKVAATGGPKNLAPEIAAKPRILFVVNAEWYFLSHRISLARALRNKGFDVTVSANSERGQEHRIEADGLRFIPHGLKRRSLSPIDPLIGVWRLYRLYRKERPDLVHHLTIKPVIYGSIAARLARVPSTINTIPGLGYMFLGKGLRGWFQRELAILAYKVALSPPAMRVIFQNPDDRDLLVTRRVLTPEKSRVIRGSGVNFEEFKPKIEAAGSPIVLLASRLIWDKGLRELIEATRIAKAKGIVFRTVLVGTPDLNNPNAVPLSTLEDWKTEGIVEYWGHRDDMAAVINEACIVVLPSYREGVPRVLVEAAGCGKAIIATDVPGCREVVRNAENGLLVPPKNSHALGEAMEKLLKNPALRLHMGQRGREIAVREFSEEVIINQTLAVYQELLEERWSQGN